MKRDMRQRWAPALVAGLLLGVWQAWVDWAQLPAYLLPSPWRIAQTLWQEAPLLGQAWWVTLKVTWLALGASVLLGTVVAALFVQSRWIEAAFSPYAVLLQVTPLVAIAPLIIVWVSDPMLALVVCATLVAIFPIIANTTQGLRATDAGLIDAFAIMGASRWQTLWLLRLPAALPAFLTGLRVSAGLALIGAVVAEFVAGTGGTSSGLAYQILQSGYQLDIPRLFAALVLVSVTGIVHFTLLGTLQRWCLQGWHDSTL